MTHITFRPYTRRDGELMLYVNSSTGVSIGLSSERGFAPYSQSATKGERNCWGAAHSAIRANGVKFTGDLSAHAERKILMNGWALAFTDVASIGGMTVSSDGAYLVDIAKGLIVPCSVALNADLDDAPAA